MWNPDLQIAPSSGFAGLLIGLHLAVCLALGLLGWGWLLFVPLIIVIMGYNVAKYALVKLDYSIVRVWLGKDGWYLQCRNQTIRGPLMLTSMTRLDRHFVRLSWKSKAQFWQQRHLLITPTMIGAEPFRKLSVFLRWAPSKNGNEESVREA